MNAVKVISFSWTDILGGSALAASRLSELESAGYRVRFAFGGAAGLTFQGGTSGLDPTHPILRLLLESGSKPGEAKLMPWTRAGVDELNGKMQADVNAALAAGWRLVDVVTVEPQGSSDVFFAIGVFER